MIREISMGPNISTRAYLECISYTFDHPWCSDPNLTPETLLSIANTPNDVSDIVVASQAMPSLLIFTDTSGRGKVVDSNVT